MVAGGLDTINGAAAVDDPLIPAGCPINKCRSGGRLTISPRALPPIPFGGRRRTITSPVTKGLDDNQSNQIAAPVDLTAGIAIQGRSPTLMSADGCSVSTEVAPEELLGVSDALASVAAKKEVVESREDVVVEPRKADDDTRDDRVARTISAESSVKEVVLEGDNRDECCSCYVLTMIGNDIDDAIQYFFSTIEAGCQAIVSCSACSSKSSPDEEEVDAAPKSNAMDLLANESVDKIHDGQSQGTVRTTKTEVVSATTKSVETPGCGFLSCFSCSGAESKASNQPEEPPKGTGEERHSDTPDEVLGSTLNITSPNVHVLRSFSSDNFTEGTGLKQRSRSLVGMSPKAQSLVGEIEEMEKYLFDARKSASTEAGKKMMKKRDPFIKKMSGIKQDLFHHQALLQSSAPESAKRQYYEAISHAALLNAEVETQRAELELKKLQLESMMLDEKMDQMMFIDNRISDSLGSLTLSMDETKDSLDDPLGSAFTALASYLSPRSRAVAE